MIVSTWTKVLVTVITTAALAACSSLPLPADVDLRARMDGGETGSAHVPITAGEAQEVDLRLPEDEGACFDIADEGFGVTIESAQLHWIVDARYEGPDLSGMLQARVFVAGADDELFHPSNTLGPTFTLKLDRTTTRLAGSGVLSPTQLVAVNDRYVCWGVEVGGRDVAAAEDGTATIHYDVESLRLRVRFSVL